MSKHIKIQLEEAQAACANATHLLEDMDDELESLRAFCGEIAGNLMMHGDSGETILGRVVELRQHYIEIRAELGVAHLSHEQGMERVRDFRKRMELVENLVAERDALKAEVVELRAASLVPSDVAELAMMRSERDASAALAQQMRSERDALSVEVADLRVERNSAITDRDIAREVSDDWREWALRMQSAFGAQGLTKTQCVELAGEYSAFPGKLATILGIEHSGMQSVLEAVRGTVRTADLVQDSCPVPVPAIAAGTGPIAMPEPPTEIDPAEPDPKDFAGWQARVREHHRLITSLKDSIRTQGERFARELKQVMDTFTETMGKLERGEQ